MVIRRTTLAAEKDDLRRRFGVATSETGGASAAARDEHAPLRDRPPA